MKSISLILFISFLFINGAVTDELVIVNEGFSLTLHTNAIIQNNDVIEWRFGEDIIAKLDKGLSSLFNERFQINKQNGDLTIMDGKNVPDGSFHLQITGEKTTRNAFLVSRRRGASDDARLVFVKEGDTVSLNAGSPDVKEYDVIRWRFENSSLVEINRKTKTISTLGGSKRHEISFKDRLEMDGWDGDLIVRDMRTDLSGLYEVNIISNSGTHTINKTYAVAVVAGDRSSGVSLRGSCVGVLLVFVMSQII